ncbi:hypothetical protein N9235_00700 [Gammaproteobacteria bacterium]|nr:hypothetical protein [Gammaproteobacteria bacterium]
MDEKEFEEYLIWRTERGDTEAGREILKSVASSITGMSLLLDYHAKCLCQYAEEGVQLERALGVKEEEPDKGGRPKKYDELELAAVDILLRHHAGMGPEEAVNWIIKNIGADRRATQRIRKVYDSKYNEVTDEPLMENLNYDLLLHMTGSRRKKVAEVLPQTT